MRRRHLHKCHADGKGGITTQERWVGAFFSQQNPDLPLVDPEWPLTLLLELCFYLKKIISIKICYLDTSLLVDTLPPTFFSDTWLSITYVVDGRLPTAQFFVDYLQFLCVSMILTLWFLDDKKSGHQSFSSWSDLQILSARFSGRLPVRCRLRIVLLEHDTLREKLRSYGVISLNGSREQLVYRIMLV